ncbi:hypothetical protein [Cryptosporangium sp. NPDC051539]|uniref:hypothetical protein n=1 Tax=Cryptosporangium sp. NPDC051539 TaxID=3363962 RepID=UPI003788F034
MTRRCCAALLTMVLTGSAVACDRRPDAASTRTSTTSTKADEDAARTAVKDTYDSFYRVFADAATSGTYRRSDFAKYLSEPELSSIIQTLDDLRARKVVYRDRPAWSVEVTSVDLHSRPPTAALRVCLDMSQSPPVDQRSKKTLTRRGELRRYVQTAEAKQIQGAWFIADSATQRTTPC